MEDFNTYCYPGTRYSERMFDLDDQVSLRVISFEPSTASHNIPIVMVVGLSTMIESFRDILVELTKDFPVHYIETREKKSAKIKGRISFDVQAFGMDVVKIVSMLGVEANNYVLMGYSLGATAIADCHEYIESKPKCLLLMEPTPAFHYPKWSLRLIRFAVPLYFILKPAAKWYLRRFRINTKEDMEMYLISSRALDNADPLKLKNTILAIAGYSVWQRLETIECPALIVATSKDGLHDHEDIIRMTNGIKYAKYLDLETNKRTHDAEMAIVIRNYVNNLESISYKSDLL